MKTKKLLFLMFAFGFAGAITANILFFAVAVMAEADSNPATDNLDRYLPYDGYLELDGVPVSVDDMTLRFNIYDDADNLLWTENQVINIYNGKFNAVLGQTNNITDTVFDAENIFIGIEIQSDGQWIALSGRQQINPVPFALWADHGSDFVVAGSLFAGNTSGGSIPDWFNDSYTHGVKVFAGSDNAFFGLRNRSDNGDDNSYDTVVYYGDDTNDSLIFTNEDNGDVMTLDGSGNLTVYGSLSAGSGSFGSVQWGSASLVNNQGGSIELGGEDDQIPFIDFHTSDGGTGDYDARIIAAGDDLISIDSASLRVSSGNLNVSGSITGSSLSISGDATVSGDLTASTVNDKSLSGTGLTCVSVTSGEGSSSNDRITTVSCSSGYVMTGCVCYGMWNNCDGSYIEDGVCNAQAAGGGDWIKAVARCCKVH